ncbi:MAG: endonuclease NucS domain-containing protein [Sediminibacterium sp.]
MPNQVEHIIRDWLAINPDFIEPGLQLIEKEHYLPDELGSSGFIDILCKDVYNNFVIVEIKRSDSAARQTFTEVLKYAGLIKSTYNARDSEIRIVIISTHWSEIIRAFSHSCFKSPFAIKGFQIFINELTKIPEAKEEISPISSRAFSRKFMSYQDLYLFHSNEKRQKAHEVLNQRLQKAQAYDYVALDLDAPADKKLPYPYAINAAFQKRSKEELLLSISLLDGMQHLDMEAEFDDEEAYVSYLAQVFTIALKMNDYIDTLEVGYGEKFESVTGVQGWKITSINRYGIFKSDPRYSDDLLIKELKGHDGNSSNKFVGFSESSQRERIKEIRSECQHCLSHTPSWAEFIDYILSDLERSNEKFKVIVDIYNPDSIVTALYFTLVKGNPDYLPLFLIIIDYPDIDKTVFYKGDITSIGIKQTLKLFTTTDYEEVTNELTGIWIDPDNETDAFRMGLHYSILESVFVNGCETSSGFIEIDENVIVPDASNHTSIEDYIANNQGALSVMLHNYGKYAMHHT